MSTGKQDAASFSKGAHMAMKRWRKLPAGERREAIDTLSTEVSDRRDLATTCEESDPERAQRLRRDARIGATIVAVLKAMGGARG